MSKQPKKDYIGMWYEVRREFGIPDDIHAGWLDIPNQKPQLRRYFHAETDGMGMFAQFLREHGYPCHPLPISRDGHEPSWWELYRLGKKAPEATAPKTIRWKKTREFSPGEQRDAQFRFIDRDTTGKLLQHAKKHNVSLVNWLFWALNRATAETLLDGEQQYYWLYPVNMRGQAKMPSEIANGSSGVLVCADTHSSADSLQQQVHARLKAKQHWVLWKQGQLSKYIGYPGIRYFYRKHTQANTYAGSFSYLGEWPLKDSYNPPEDPERALICCGPSSPNYPVSTAVTNWYGQLVLALRLHASLVVDGDEAERCANTWLHYLLSDIEQ